ncbi:MAG: hypothetical protein HXN00_00495 [Porphyromonadaceae bacterium]|nr:hypothetical protein [Porphyromonadaceae bacterium]
MSINGFIADITDQLTAWDAAYTETTDGLRSGDISLTVTTEYPITATITQGDDVVAITSDAGRAVALLAWPLFRAAWAEGYCGDVDVDIYPDSEEVELTLTYGSEDVTILAGHDWAPGQEFTITRHPLLWSEVTMTDLGAALESTEYAYQTPAEAWQVLCGAVDYEQDSWETIVETLLPDARIAGGSRLTRVTHDDRAALVEDCDPESPVRVIDVDAVEDGIYWSPQDAAAAVLTIIA